jgi:hypothetical protein
MASRRRSFSARSGTPYAYTADGDANADGVSNNDLLFIPRSASDMNLSNPDSFPLLDAYIGAEPCLRRQRGRIMSRNSCRNPAVYNADVSIAKTLMARGLHGFVITADVFDLPNLLNRNWGLVRESAIREDKQGLLSVVGWDAAANRPRYAILTAAGGRVLATRNAVVVDASRWRMQLGARYNF